ncbi:amino acid permease [Veillonella ratti]|uniref:amino acid permease n=1 Tax=Veillonella ratti TaxID=103892 RepID=UPI001D039351|nr:amino acid permease [Veillonella ratti]MCB5743948.1 amino acid permease [Veillonella ratti]MCB5757978.1 amino acid permease [Veillonella ratti]MCB5760226.1 amino acid permease [Veillonella ratti]MCB5762577.1 amino acid permease [Veillonella ratti]MCB5782876.1 amino acid permease [Veillonella ratti]
MSDAANTKLKRSLKSRHMNMIALGGSIGTGLFVAGGEVVSTAGPGGALVAYGFIGIMVYFLMTSLGEMATYLPVPGSFGTYVSRYVDPAFGFALGWNYWFNWAITLAAELVAGALIMKYWFPDIPAIVWSALFLAALFLMNYLSTRSFGESEYFFSSMKVITVFVFLFVGTMLILGIGGTSPGFENWTRGEAPFVGGFASIMAIFMVAGFSFQGTELIGVAAGESEDPEKNIPKAIHSIFCRILLFYIGAFVVIGFLIPYDDPNLLNSSVENVAISPFTLVLDRFGFAFAASFINAIILTAVLSAGNSGLYASTRMLYAMAKEGDAPKVFTKLNSRGVPVPALLATAAFGVFAFLTSLIGEGTAYNWLINISGMSGFIAWLGIAIAHYRFRRAFHAQGKSLDAIPFKALFYPFGPIFATVLCLIIIAGQNYTAFTGETIDWYGASVAYIGIPVFLLVYAAYKSKYKTHVIPLKEVNLDRDYEK